MLDPKKVINKQLCQDLEMCGFMRMPLQISLDLEIWLISTESHMIQKGRCFPCAYGAQNSEIYTNT